MSAGRDLEVALRYLRSHCPAGLDKGRAILDRCLERMPDDPECLAVRAYQLVLEWREGATDRSALNQALALSKRAVRTGGQSYLTHWSKAIVRSNQRHFEDALASYGDALARAEDAADPERVRADIRVERADALVYKGEPQLAADEILTVRRADSPAWYDLVLGWAYYNLGRTDGTFYAKAVETLKPLDAPMAVWLIRAAAWYRMGREHATAARAAINEFRYEQPDWTVRDEAGGPFRSDLERDGPDSDEFHWLEALKGAGLPDPDEVLPLP